MDQRKFTFYCWGNNCDERLISHTYLLLPRICTTHDQISKIIQVEMRKAEFHSPTCIIPRIIQEYNYTNIKENCMVSTIIDSVSTITDSVTICQIRKHYITLHLGNIHCTTIHLGK